MTRNAARFAVLLVAFALAGCGGDGGDSGPDHASVESFPDVLEIARAELGEDAALHEVEVEESRISFVHAQFGRNVRVVYNDRAVFVANERVRERFNPGGVFRISEVPADAPEKLLAAIREREDGDVTGFEAKLNREKNGALLWKAGVTVDGARKQYEAELDGTLRG